jgi:hypothetical protein
VKCDACEERPLHHLSGFRIAKFFRTADQAVKFLTVMGASFSNSRIVIAPNVVFITA